MLYVVLCTYGGCEECSSGSHVVGVFDTETQAEVVSREHQRDEQAHLHYFSVDVQRFQLNKVGQ